MSDIEEDGNGKMLSLITILRDYNIMGKPDEQLCSSRERMVICLILLNHWCLGKYLADPALFLSQARECIIVYCIPLYND